MLFQQVNIVNEFLHKLVEVLVEGPDLALCIFGERLRVDDDFALRAIVDNDAFQAALLPVLELLRLVLARQVLSVRLLVPHLEKQSAAMVLQICQICINVNVRLNQSEKHIPSVFDAL